MKDPDKAASERSDHHHNVPSVWLRASFDIAIELPSEERPGWILHNVTDPQNRALLARLLEFADADAYDFLDTPVVEHVDRLAADQVLAESLVGQRIGAFRLVRLLGKGGMAAVFLGTRDLGDFEQNVAVKLLRRGLYSEIEQRLFLRERQVLASLNHPNIARLFDGGLTDAGIPYLVMEYVDGQQITHHTASNALDFVARLRLFLTVCRAVAAAHRALIVHRDIKPANILVTTDGTVKLLDFGVAKLLEDDVDGGTAGVFTPAYAAPEQLTSQPVTTATDVYSLGVLLHELLIGTRPDSVSRRPSLFVCDPAREWNGTPAPALLRKQLRGDLDNIILKALAPEPDHRYSSAGALGDDIDRHLNGHPVSAHAPSRSYRARKFVSRHKGSVTATVVVVVAILAALGVALWQAEVARKQAIRALENERIAREQAQRADATRRFLVGVFDQAEPDANLGHPITARQLLASADQQLAAETDLEAGIRLDLSVLMANLYWDLGDYEHAEPLLKQVENAASWSTISDEVKARTLATIASVESQKRHFPDAIEHANQAIAAATRAGHAADDSASDARRAVATSLHGQDNSKDAEPLMRAALATDRALYGDRHPNVLADWTELGGELTELSRFEEATTALRTAVDLARVLHGPLHSSVARALQELAGSLGYAGNDAESERVQREALGVYEKVFGAEHVETLTARSNLLWNLENQSRYQEALLGRLELSNVMQRQITARPEVIASNYARIGNDYSKLGRLADAEPAVRQSLAIWAKLQGSNDEWDSADPMLILADVVRWRGRSAEAEAIYRRAIAIEARHEPSASGWLNRDRSALGDVLREQHRYAEALKETTAAFEARGDVKPDPVQCQIVSRLSLAQLESGDAATAHATAETGVTMARSVLRPGQFSLGLPLLALGRADLALGRTGEAVAVLREALAVRSPPLPRDDPRTLEVKLPLLEALDKLGLAAEARALRAEGGASR